MKTGFFTMDHVRLVCNCSDITTARQVALEAINAQEAAKQENVRKAIAMVNKSKTPNALGLAMSNFVLAHPSENLKTIQ